MGLILDTSILIAEERGRFDFKGIRRRLGMKLGLTLNCRVAAGSKLNMARKTSKMGGFTLIEILIAVVLVVLLFAVAIPMLTRKHPEYPGHMACITNLRMIDAAKGQWALENQK
ncbi:MAG: prepilin-type N-terminal cleavage/methylation domain-containing protein, partial [Verrucomicrobiota bacterium]